MFSFQHLAPRHRKSCGLNISYQLDLRINVSYQVSVRVNAQFSRIILAVQKCEGESWQLQHFCERIRLHTLCWCLFRENACKACLWAVGDQIKKIFFSKIVLSNVWKMSYLGSFSQAVGVLSSCEEENDRIEGVAIVQSTLYLNGSARDCFAKGRESYCSEM